jgi:hypothetical protein
MIITNGKIGVERKDKMTFSTCREKSAAIKCCIFFKNPIFIFEKTPAANI